MAILSAPGPAPAASPAPASAQPVRGPVLLIVNPASRRGSARRRRAAAAFDAHGVPYELVETTASGHAATVALARCHEFDAVFTLGGDGTAIEVVGALAGSGQRVGILPGGTGNLVARTLGIPLDVRRAVAALLAGAEAHIDLGLLDDGRRFAFTAGVGVDAEMIARTPHRWKRRLGVLAYALTAGRGVLRRDTFRVRATVDGRVYDRRASSVMVANFGTVLDRLITLGPDIREDDGLLDLCIFSPANGRQALLTIWRLMRRDFRAAPYLLWVPGREFRIETDPPHVAQADGELLGTAPLNITVQPRAARLLVPAAGRGAP